MEYAPQDISLGVSYSTLRAASGVSQAQLIMTCILRDLWVLKVIRHEDLETSLALSRLSPDSILRGTRWYLGRRSYIMYSLPAAEPWSSRVM